MSDYTVLIDAVEYDVLKDNFDLNWQANWQSTLACDLPSYDGTYRPDLRATVVLKRDGTAIFGGILTQAPEQGLGGPNLDQIVHHLNAVGFETYFTYRYVTLTIHAGTTVKAAMLLLLAGGYFPASVAIDPAQPDGPALTEDLPFERTRLDEALKAITADTAYIPRITPDELFQMRNPAATPAPFDILDTGPTESGGKLFQLGDLRVERTLDDAYANSIIGEIRGAGPATDPIPSFVAADGVTAGGYVRFKVKYPASESIGDWWPNELYIAGVKIGGIGRIVTSPQAWDVPLAGWNWDMTTEPATLRYTVGSGADFPVGAQALTVNPPLYSIRFPFYVTGNDLTDQATHPIKEAFVSIDEALPIEAAQARVDALASSRAAVLERAVYTTEQDTLETGMVQTINTPKRGINASVLITGLRLHSEPERDGGDLVTDVTAIVGTEEHGNVRQTYKDWLKQGGAGPSRTGVAGSQAAPPQYAIQRYKDGVLAGSEFALLDPDRTGDTYGVGPDQHTAAFGVATGTAGILALFNKAAGKLKALCFSQSNTGVTTISKANATGTALNITNYDGDVNVNADNIGLTVDDKASNYIRLIGLAESQGLMPVCRRVTSNYTVDSTIGSGGLLDLAIFGNGTLTVSLPALTSSTILAGTVYRRCLMIANVGSGSVTIDPNSTETINGGSTLVLAAGQAVLIQALTGTDAGWYVIGSHGLGFTVPGSDKQVFFNDGGLVGANSGLTFDKTLKQLGVTQATTDESAVRLDQGSASKLMTMFFGTFAIGMDHESGADIARVANPGYFYADTSAPSVSMGLTVGETPNTAAAYARYTQWDVAPESAILGGIAAGTGAHPGFGIGANRNAAGSGAAGNVVLYDKAGTPYYLWVEAGKLRIHTAPPTEDNTTVSHTAGTVVGTQS